MNAKITLGLAWCMSSRHDNYQTRSGVWGRTRGRGRRGGRGMGRGVGRERVGGEKGKRAKERRRWC